LLKICCLHWPKRQDGKGHTLKARGLTGMTNGKLQQAINFAMAHETGWARSPDQSPWGVHQTDPAPWNRLFGPVHERGGVCGVIMQDGNVLAGFGDTGRADLTFSVAKTYLALLAGVAHEPRAAARRA
jgi:hypothetical protein